MALFGKNDQDLPLLTQFYQLEPPPKGWEQDIDLLVQSEFGKWFNKEQDKAIEWGDEIEDLFSAARLHPIACSIMDSVHDTKTLLVTDLYELEKSGAWWQTLFVDEKPIDHMIVEDGAEERRVSIQSLRLGTFRVNVESEIRGDLHAIITGQKQVARCTECKSVFLVRKTGQSYCSHRCADRVGTRRRRRSVGEKQDVALV